MRRALLAAFLGIAPTLGCGSITASLTSPSDSIAASSRSIAGSFQAISNSSGSGGGKTLVDPNKASYERDLREYTASFTNTRATREDFLRGVARIAEDHGISHWEADSTTPFAIGQGLHDAGWSEAQMNDFIDQVGPDEPAAQIALEGWQQAGG